MILLLRDSGKKTVMNQTALTPEFPRRKNMWQNFFRLFSLNIFVFATAHVDNEVYLGRALERLGDAALKEQEPDIGAAFLKFAVVTKELSALMKTLVRKNDICIRADFSSAVGTK